MKLRDLRTWVESLPLEFDGYSVVFAEAIYQDKEIVLSKPGIGMLDLEIDNSHEEIILWEQESDKLKWDLSGLRTWLYEKSHNVLDYDCVISSSYVDDEESSGSLTARLDRTITVCDIDEENCEVVIAWDK